MFVPLRKKTLLRYSLIVLSVMLGAVLHFGRFDSYEIPYIVAIQQAALLSNTMWFFQLYAHLGDSIVWVGLTLLLLAFYSKRPKKALKLALFIGVIALVVVMLRLAFPRQRPFDEFPLRV